MDLMQVCLCALVLSLEFVCCQVYNPQCSTPGVFSYEREGNTVYGKIVLEPTEPVSTLTLNLNFTIAAQVLGNYVGRIEPIDGNSILQKYNRGEAVSYRVHFPVTSPLPKLTSLTVNGDTICSGHEDVARPNSYLTKISLSQTSFLQSGSRVVYSEFRPKPQQSLPVDIENVFNYGDDGTSQIYVINNIDPTSWNIGGYDPFKILNTSRPFMQSTKPVYKPPTQPVIKPTRPVINTDQFVPYETTTKKPVYIERRPVINRPREPVYDQVTMRPVYEAPEVRPQRPSEEERPEEVDYRETEQTTVRSKPRPVNRPSNRQPEPEQLDANNECGMISGGNDNVALIYHGESYQRGDLPWLAALYKTEGSAVKFICGGTLISNRHIVTAGHCLQIRSKRTAIRDIVVKVGVHNLNDWGDEITVTAKLIAAKLHEGYADTPALKNDIAIFTLNRHVEFNKFIRPACLWNGDADLSRIVGDTGVVAGWGDQNPGGGGRWGEPNRVRIPIVSTTKCRASKPSFYHLTSETTLCAGNRDGSGPCIGDSGGGLYILEGGKWRVRGIVSLSLRAANGDATCNLDEYIVFTDVAQYLPWIRSAMAENFFD